MTRRNNVWANIDWTTVVLYLVMVLLGWVNIYAAVYNEEHHSILDISQRYGKQMLWIGAAIIIAFFVLVVDSKFYVAFAYPFYIITILSLVAVLLIGTEIKGAKSWIEMGDFRIQPSEFAKFATGLALAKLLSKFNFKIHRFKSLVSVVFLIGLPMGLILLQNDTGSALVYAALILVLFREGLSGVVIFFGLLMAILFIMVLLLPAMNVLLFIVLGSFIAYGVIEGDLKNMFKLLFTTATVFAVAWGIDQITGNKFSVMHELLASSILVGLGLIVTAFRQKLSRLALIIGVFFAALLFTNVVDYAFNNILEPHQQNRIEVLLGKKSDPLGVGWNTHQSMIAIGSGGLSGKGFLRGTQTKFDFVPEQSTDFIFCTVGEEWGFIGTITINILFLILFLRLLFLAERQRSVFSRVYGYVVVCILFFHFAINIGMTIKLAPVIGIPLPFFSYGGSSLWSFTILLFIFLKLDSSRLERL